MEDAATAEISRAQLCSGLHHHAVMDDGFARDGGDGGCGDCG